MGRIENTFARLRQKGEKALIVYLAAGDPDLPTTKALITALEASGVDILEIGVPFSDPTADGPVIQAASLRAIKNKTTLAAVFDMIADIRQVSEIPIVLFGYYNPVFSFGGERFARQAKTAGVDGLLVVDLPPEEAQELRLFTDPAGIDFISLVAPTTDDERLRRIIPKAGGFLYYISVTGVTGTAKPKVEDIRRDMARIRRVSDLPVAVGFGITTAKEAALIAPYADGVVVGSAVVKLIEENSGRPDLVARVSTFTAAIKKALQEGVRT